MDTITDIELKQRAERAQIRSDAELFEELMRHKGWARYVSLVETIGQNYHGKIMQPLESALACVQVEFAKGVLSGLSLATAIPQLKIKEAQEFRRGNGADDEENT